MSFKEDLSGGKLAYSKHSLFLVRPCSWQMWVNCIQGGPNSFTRQGLTVLSAMDKLHYHLPHCGSTWCCMIKISIPTWFYFHSTWGWTWIFMGCHLLQSIKFIDGVQLAAFVQFGRSHNSCCVWNTVEGAVNWYWEPAHTDGIGLAEKCSATACSAKVHVI